jgi:hypothetical protein
VLVVRTRGDDLGRAGEHVHLDHRLVRAAVAVRRRLDAQPGHRAAERDRLELRDDERHEPMTQRRVDEVLVRRHPEHVGGARLRVHRQDAVEAGRVER